MAFLCALHQPSHLDHMLHQRICIPHFIVIPSEQIGNTYKTLIEDPHEYYLHNLNKYQVNNGINNY